MLLGVQVQSLRSYWYHFLAYFRPHMWKIWKTGFPFPWSRAIYALIINSSWIYLDKWYCRQAAEQNLLSHKCRKKCHIGQVRRERCGKGASRRINIFWRGFSEYIHAIKLLVFGQMFLDICWHNFHQHFCSSTHFADGFTSNSTLPITQHLVIFSLRNWEKVSPRNLSFSHSRNNKAQGKL